jgi:excisionase family DNA binding protein
MDVDELLTVREAAARLKVSTRTIRRYILDGTITATMPLSDRAGWRIRAHEIDRISEQQKKKPPEP